MQDVLHQLDLKETGTTSVTEGTQTLTTTAGDGRAVLNLNRRLPDVGTRFSTSDHQVFRVALGVRGALGDVSPGFLRDLHYDVYYSYAQTTEADTQTGSISLSHFQNAILSQGGAAPVLNPFGQNMTDAGKAAILINSNAGLRAEQQVFAGNLTGELFDLPAGPVDFSTGFEWRYDFGKYIPDSYLASGDVSGWNAARATQGSTTVKELYGEFRAPILSDVPGFKRLSLNGAFRYSDYDTPGVGGVWTYSIGRNGRSPAMSPSAPSTSTPSAPPTPANCTAAAAPTGRRPPIRARAASRRRSRPMRSSRSVSPPACRSLGGNANQAPEKSNTTTVWRGPDAARHQRPATERRTTTRSRSTTPSRPLGGGGLQSELKHVLQRASGCQQRLLPGDPSRLDRPDRRPPDYVTTTNANIGGIRTSGIDIEGHYGFGTDWGLLGASRWDIAEDWTYVKEFTVTPDQTLPNIKNYCVGALRRHLRPAEPALEGHDAPDLEDGCADPVGARPLPRQGDDRHRRRAARTVASPIRRSTTLTNPGDPGLLPIST
ncbi:MAG: hypothetical protein WDN06_16975 [Asticcacaulis sp.]